MARISKVAIFAALIAGGAAVVTVPAQAKKEEAPAAPKLGPDARKHAVEAQTALGAKDWAAAQTAIDALDGVAKTDDERYYASTFRLQLESGKLNAAAAADPKAMSRGIGALAAPLDALLANPRTSNAEKGRYSNLRGQIEYDAQRYAQAVTFFTQARDFGFTDPDLGLNIVRAKMEAGDLDGGAAEMAKQIDAEKAAGRTPPDTWYRYVISKFAQANKQQQLVQWLQLLVKAYPTPQNWRQAILIYGFEGQAYARLDKRQHVDLFRLMRATKSLADKSEYLEYAQGAYDIGLPAEAKAVVEEGRASGKLPTTNTAGTMLLSDSTSATKAETPFATLEKQAAAAKTGDASTQTADVYLSSGDYAKAVTFYRAGLAKGVAKADEVNTHLGIALALSGDKDGARAAFANVKTVPRSEIVSFWMLWLDLPATAA